MTYEQNISTKQAVSIRKALVKAQEFIENSDLQCGYFAESHNAASHAGLKELADALMELRNARHSVYEANQSLDEAKSAALSLLEL